jgi:hypothetical protein
MKKNIIKELLDRCYGTYTRQAGTEKSTPQGGTEKNPTMLG